MNYDFRTVAYDYCTSWFLPDLISGIPFRLFADNKALGNSGYIKILKGGKALKSLRLVRMLKVTKLFKSFQTLG